MKVGLDGVEFLGASASEWINGGIRILPGDKGEMKASYPLYANLEKALENSLSDLPTTTVSLSAETLPDVQAGSVVLYRKFEVGEVITVRPRANAFDIDLHIKPEYRNLLTSNSVVLGRRRGESSAEWQRPDRTGIPALQSIKGSH